MGLPNCFLFFKDATCCFANILQYFCLWRFLHDVDWRWQNSASTKSFLPKKFPLQRENFFSFRLYKKCWPGGDVRRYPNSNVYSFNKNVVNRQLCSNQCIYCKLFLGFRSGSKFEIWHLKLKSTSKTTLTKVTPTFLYFSMLWKMFKRNRFSNSDPLTRALLAYLNVFCEVEVIFCSVNAVSLQVHPHQLNMWEAIGYKSITKASSICSSSLCILCLEPIQVCKKRNFFSHCEETLFRGCEAAPK